MATYLRPVVGIAISFLEILHIGRGFRRWIRTYGNTVDVIMTISKNVKIYNSPPSIQIRKRQNWLIVDSIISEISYKLPLYYLRIYSVYNADNQYSLKILVPNTSNGDTFQKKNKNTASPQIKFFLQSVRKQNVNCVGMRPDTRMS